MRRPKNARRKQPGASDPGNESAAEIDCLERLHDELEHPTRSRRQGARAAIRYLNELVNLRATTGELSRQKAWIHVFDTNQSLVALAADDRALRAPDPARDGSKPLSVEEIVQTIELSIIRREQARAVAPPSGELPLVDLCSVDRRFN